MGTLLDRIGHPQDLKRYSLDQLRALAAEIRDVITTTVARTGGHLAPNLGVVELTIALLYKLNLPTDEIVWDVGHQCYPFKLLTGRAGRFHTLRTYGGIAGFPKRSESEFDVFETGHSSTSISVCVGKAIVRDLKGHRNNIAAVIGDGALTAGMAMEALNHAGRLSSKLLVVLNDNTMSIEENVGAYSRYLNRIRMYPFYRSSKEYVEDLISSIPRVGRRLLGIVNKVEDSVKYLVVPGVVFEELGFTYLGPVDGHDLEELMDSLDLALVQEDRPVLLHVKTVKGKGYPPAERNKPLFHGTGPFDVSTGTPVKKEGQPPSYTSVFGRAVVERAREDERIVAITAAMAPGTGLDEFARTFPSRFFDVGIAEQHAVTFAAGIASSGCKPVVAIYSTFLQRAYDQIVHDVCLQDMPVVFAVDRGGLVGEDGPTHHGVFDLCFLRSIPGMTLMAPSDEQELVDMLTFALELGHPVAFRYPRGSAVGVELDYSRRGTVEMGKGRLLRKGKDVVFVCAGPLVHEALAAAEALHSSGVDAAVVDARFVKPLDEELILDLASTTSRVVTVEENVVQGGFGSAVGELLHERGSSARLVKVGVPDCFIEHGAVSILRRNLGLDAAGLQSVVEKMLEVD